MSAPNTDFLVLAKIHSYKLHCCTLPDKRCLSHGMFLYQVMMTLHFLNDVANDAESIQNKKLRHNC